MTEIWSARKKEGLKERKKLEKGRKYRKAKLSVEGWKERKERTTERKMKKKNGKRRRSDGRKDEREEAWKETGRNKKPGRKEMYKIHNHVTFLIY